MWDHKIRILNQGLNHAYFKASITTFWCICWEDGPNSLLPGASTWGDSEGWRCSSRMPCSSGPRQPLGWIPAQEKRNKCTTQNSELWESLGGHLHSCPACVWPGHLGDGLRKHVPCMKWVYNGSALLTGTLITPFFLPNTLCYVCKYHNTIIEMCVYACVLAVMCTCEHSCPRNVGLLCISSDSGYELLNQGAGNLSQFSSFL